MPNNADVVPGGSHDPSVGARQGSGVLRSGEGVEIEQLPVLNENAGLIALGIIGTPPQVAQFRVAFQGAALVAFGLLAINTLVAPYFSRLYSGRNIEQLSELIKISARISFSLAVLATTLFIIFGERIIKLMFGSEYDAAYLPLVILSFGQLVNAFCGPVHHLLYMTGKEREVLICVAVATSMTVALSILLIPSYGESGAAAALSITLCGMNVILALRARALLGIDSTAMGRPARIIEKGA